MRAEHIQYRVDQQVSTHDIIKSAYANLIKVGRNNLTTTRIQNRLDAVQEQWHQFNTNHQAIQLALAMVDSRTRRTIEERSYFAKELYKETYELYLEATGMMQELLAEKSSQPGTSKSPDVQIEEVSTPLMRPIQHQASTSGLISYPRLSKIDVPKFNGTLSEWLSFKGLYMSLVDKNPFISDVEKLQYLKTSLVGPAAFLLKGTDVITENLQPAWEAVLAFYENERRLVNSALKSLFSLKKMTKDSAKELETLYMSFNEVYRTLESLNRPVQHCNDFLVFMMTQRLDPESVKAWEIHLGASRTTPTWQQLKEFLESRLLSLQSFESSQTSLSNKVHQTSTARTHFTSATPSCPMCTKNHHLYQCESFLAKAIKQRREYVLSKGLCFNCTGNHKVAKCQSPRRCRNCGKKHHTKLHISEQKSASQSSEESGNKQVNHVSNGSKNSTTVTVLLATAQAFLKNKQGEKRNIWVLLDTGSEISLISERMVQMLRLPRQKSSISIIGVGNTQAGKARGNVNVILSPHFDPLVDIEIQAFVLPKLTSFLPSSECSACPSWDHLQNLQLADPSYKLQKQIDLIIGADYYGQLLEGSVIKGPINAPVAQLTTLGWFVSGPANMSQARNASIHHCSIDHDLNEILEKFWIQEELPRHNSPSLSPEDQLCENHFQSTHQRDSTGRYILRLPFKTSTDELGNSITPSQRALHNLESKFEKNPEYCRAYKAFINEYKDLNHMIQVPNQEQDPKSVFYLPHHGVIREISTTTKLRVVFNGSCRTPAGKPLNELLCTGAKLQVDLLDVLLWFRQFRYIFSADVEKMYRQINIHPEDWDYQRILWKENGRLTKYQLTTVTYGLACAPFQALRTILQLIRDDGHKFPQAIDTLKYGRYVDDIFGGADIIEDAQEKAVQIKQLCMAGGFPLKKWVSNHPTVLAQIPQEEQTPTTTIRLQDDTVRVLGLFWNPSTNLLRFQFSALPQKIVSKRSVLSKIVQLFDPLGLLSPVFIKLKIFMQELWAVKLTWDEQLPEEQMNTWIRLQTLLHGLDSISIPRWIGLDSSSQIEIHGFCDASQTAMAAAVYLRTSKNGATVSQLLCSKTKVAPLKRMTIPRLELSAAVMLAKLVKHCQQVLKLNNTQCHFWTDSTIVHTWISNHPSKWKDFVHNRVCIIQEAVQSAHWHHIDGKSNPADCGTRGLSAEALKIHALWWTGPEWLLQDYTHWPKPVIKPITNQNLEMKSTHHVMTIQQWDLMLRFSSWRKLIRITAWCQRIAALFLKRPVPEPKTLITPEDLNTAIQFIIKYHQRRYFAIEVTALKEGRELPRNSPLVRLWPRLDQFGLLRVGGRLNNSLLTEDTKHPYILQRHAHVSKLLIEDAHQKTLHGSTRDTLVYLRQKYWIIGGRAPVRSIILKCITCTRHRRQHAQHLMGQLPPSRVTPSRPFLHSGVDYAGPFMMKTWHGKKARLYKAWIAVFVCFATSAVHLEIVSDYSSTTFIAAYKRFTSRRGICATITSDCGTTFQGADKELKALFSQHSNELHHIASIISSDGTKWKFNPPSAPHFGGKAEAAVKSMKYHLKRFVGETKLTYEQMATIITQIEAILNSRPLCAVTNDPEDLNVLTPAHFLVGQALTLVPEPNLEHIKTPRLSHWQHLTKIIQGFWTIWSEELLQRYQAVYKWNKPAQPITKGDLVLVMDERFPPAKWPLGRVIDTHPGRDNIVRVATIKTSTSIYQRPVVKLVPLPIASSEEEFAAKSSEGGR